MDDEGEPLPFNSYYVLQCLGCNAVTMQHAKWDGGKYYRTEDDEIVYSDEAISYFPPRTVRARPSWLKELPKEFTHILREVYAALDAGAPTLAAIGVRTVLDVLANTVVGDLGAFPSKLDALETKGWLSKLDRARLGVVVDAGNAAAHRAFQASPQSLDHMMEVLEHLLKSRYVLDVEAKRLKRATPKRRKQPKKVTGPKPAL